MTKTSIILFSLSLLLHLFLAKSENPLAPALYVFGDSLFDNGNNNFLPTIIKANFPPYGVDFVDGATGRFTNGKTVADFTAEMLGLPYPPPYLSLKSLETLTGMNYASASCGILPETGRIYGKCLHLDQQIDYFQKTVERELPIHFGSEKNISEYLSKSVFVVTFGSNDYIQNYILFNKSKHCSPQAFTQLLTDGLSKGFQRLYKLGARKILMYEVGAIGCLPLYTMRSPKGQCVEDHNQLATYFNDQLAAMLKRLTSDLHGSTFVIGKIYGLSNDMFQNSTKYGLTNTGNACCISPTLLCTPALPPCLNVDDHYFWDSFHPTQAAYSIMAKGCFNGSSPCSPTNIQQLLHT